MKVNFDIGQCVRVARDLPDVGLAHGALGVVVALFETPVRAYEIEFVDDDGATIATVPIREEDLTPLEPSAQSEAPQ